MYGFYSPLILVYSVWHPFPFPFNKNFVVVEAGEKTVRAVCIHYFESRQFVDGKKNSWNFQTDEVSI